MKRNLKRKLIGGLCLTSIAFVFQACYGTPQDFGNDMLIEGEVKSKSTGRPIKGIRVSIADNVQYTNTDDQGKFSLYIERSKSLNFMFSDIDANQNSQFISKDTLLTINDSIFNSAQPTVFLNIELENK